MERLTEEQIVLNFWARVETLGECWRWTGTLTTGGYGTYRNEGAHRWAYENLKAPIPKGYVIDHLCRNRQCVNPEHLEAVTPTVNSRRVPKRLYRLEKMGKPFDPIELVVSRRERMKIRLQRVRDKSVV